MKLKVCQQQEIGQVSLVFLIKQNHINWNEVYPRQNVQIDQIQVTENIRLIQCQM